MANEMASQPRNIQGGYQPQQVHVEQQLGYRPQVAGPLKPENLKPPKGGSAIVRPKPPAAK